MHRICQKRRTCQSQSCSAHHLYSDSFKECQQSTFSNQSFCIYSLLACGVCVSHEQGRVRRIWNSVLPSIPTFHYHDIRLAPSTDLPPPPYLLLFPPSFLTSTPTSMALQSVLVTGCSVGGIGYSIAEEFQKRGLHVFATARTPSKMGSIGDLPNVSTLALDVTSPSSIAAAFEAVKAKTGGTLDYLVNNSGSQYVMPTLDLDIEEAKKMFDVNVWGVIAVTQAFAPLIIAAKGSIVNAASIAGCLYPPWMGKTVPPPFFILRLNTDCCRRLRRIEISHCRYQRDLTLGNGALWRQGHHMHYRCHQHQSFRQRARAQAPFQLSVFSGSKADRGEGQR